MRKIIVFNLITVDGFFAGPKGEIDWHNYDDEMGRYSVAQMKSLGMLIFGKTTYEMMAGYWPTPDGIKSEPVVAGIMNSIPKLVFSKTLKAQNGGDIAIFGSGTIVQQFTNLGFIDEYRLIVNPVILGSGKPLFKNAKERLKLKLLSTRMFENGNVLLRYQPEKLQ